VPYFRPTFVALLSLTLASAAVPTSRAADADPRTAAQESSSEQPSAASPATRPGALDAETIRAAFADLDDPDATKRRQAYERLMGMTRADLDAFRNVVDQARPLAPSQAAVLREIVSQAFLSGEPYKPLPHAGFLGVKLQVVAVTTPVDDPAPNAAPAAANAPAEVDPFHAQLRGGAVGADTGRVGILIYERVPGFCGARSLVDGDVILSIVGHPLRMTADRFDRQLTEEFSMVVREFGPGATVTFELLRQGRVMRVPVKLDARPELADPNFAAPPGTETLDDFNLARRRKADRYWNQTFRPLLGEQVG
jgi:hypothetical protein